MEPALRHEDRQALFRLIARLLEYPDAAWQQAVPAFRVAIPHVPDQQIAANLTRFLDLATEGDPDALRDHYVQTFDFGQATNLYVTYGAYGEQRERGQALLALKQLYERAGFVMHENELPDYLPLILEFASCAPAHEVEPIFAAHRPAIARIYGALRNLKSPYAYVFAALLLALGQGEREVHDAGEDEPCAGGTSSCG